MTRSTTRHPSTLYSTLFGLVRTHLWAPDGRPPAGWNERREGSVLKRLLCHRTVSQVEVALIGLGLLRASGTVSWLQPGQKVTSRALYNSRSGVSQMFELATSAYWREMNQRPKNSGPSPMAQILRDIASHT